MTYRNGFTIVESLIVLVILTVLTMVLIALWKHEPEEPGAASERPALQAPSPDTGS